MHVNFYILIFFSEITLSIGAKLGRNVHWMVLSKVYVFSWAVVHEKTHKKPKTKSCRVYFVIFSEITTQGQFRIGTTIGRNG